MATYYRIVDWDQHYEVDQDNRAWKPGKPFRQGPLDYLRVKARGRDFSRSSLALADLAGESMYWSVGAFQKMIEIVAKSPRPLRTGGIIRNRKGSPATRDEVAWMLRVKPETLKECLRLLAHPEVAWLEEVSADSAEVGESPQKSAKSAELADASETRGNQRTRAADIRSESSHSQDNTETESSQEQGSSFTEQPTGQPPSNDPGDLFLRAGFDSTRLGFLRELRIVLRPQSNSDHQAIINFEQWLHEQILRDHATVGAREKRLTDVIRLARDCRNGDSPMAVFMSRIRSELGYVPPSRQVQRTGPL